MEDNIDEALLPIREHILGHTLVLGDIIDNEAGIEMTVTEIGIETPIELQVLTDENGSLIIGSSPPLYFEETTIMPVFHSMKFTAVRRVINL